MVEGKVGWVEGTRERQGVVDAAGEGRRKSVGPPPPHRTPRENTKFWAGRSKEQEGSVRVLGGQGRGDPTRTAAPKNSLGSSW